MSKYQNSNVAFRCPKSLKEKMKLVAEGREEHLSSFIRSACLEVIKRELPSDIPANYFNEIYTNRLSDL
jgi:hypothetical protein